MSKRNYQSESADELNYRGTFCACEMYEGLILLLI